MADNLKIGEWIHNKFPMSNACYWFLAEPSNAGHLFFALHVDDPCEITAVRVSSDSNKLSDVNGLPIVEAFFIDVPNPHWIVA